MRYTCPIFIAVLPATALLLGRCEWPFSAEPKIGAETSRITHLAIAIVICQGIVIAMFWDVFIERIRRARKQRTPLAFPIDDVYIKHNATVLSGRTEERIRSFQDKTRQGDTILAWMSLPFHLDFTRNKILIVNAGGLSSPSLNLRLDASRQAMLDHFRELDIQYVFRTYGGRPMRSEQELLHYLSIPLSTYRWEGKNGLYFHYAIQSLTNKDTTIFDDGRNLVLDIRNAVAEEDSPSLER